MKLIAPTDVVRIVAFSLCCFAIVVNIVLAAVLSESIAISVATSCVALFAAHCLLFNCVRRDAYSARTPALHLGVYALAVLGFS